MLPEQPLPPPQPRRRFCCTLPALALPPWLLCGLLGFGLLWPWQTVLNSLPAIQLLFPASRIGAEQQPLAVVRDDLLFGLQVVEAEAQGLFGCTQPGERRADDGLLLAPAREGFFPVVVEQP